MCESLNLKLSHPAFATRYFMCESFWLLSRWISCTPSKLTSGNVGKRENTRTWLLLSEVTIWSSKIKAAPLSNSCSYCLLTVEYCIVFAMKDIPQLYSSVVILKEDLWCFWWYVCRFCVRFLLGIASDCFWDLFPKNYNLTLDLEDTTWKVVELFAVLMCCVLAPL